MFRTTILAFFAMIHTAGAAPSGNTSGFSERISSVVKQLLEEQIPGAEIRLPSLEKLAQQPAITSFSEIRSGRLIEDRPSGAVLVELIGVDSGLQEKTERIQTPYQAWKKVPVAVRRIYPNTKLTNEDFRLSEVNVASGSAREYRGVMLPPGTEFQGMQTRQTILENQMALTSAVQKQPDLRKGDTVKLLLTSGGLELVTQATAEEPASVGDRVRVLTVKGKREMVGKVNAERNVEVSL